MEPGQAAQDGPRESESGSLFMCFDAQACQCDGALAKGSTRILRRFLDYLSIEASTMRGHGRRLFNISVPSKSDARVRANCDLSVGCSSGTSLENGGYHTFPDPKEPG